MLIKERIQSIIKMNNLTSSAFADKLGVQRSNISHILSGRNKPSLDLLEKIILTFPRVNAHWLITGEVKKLDDKSEGITSLMNRSVNTDSTLVSILKCYSDGTFEELILKRE
jgi:transcriptional regulator with XRE-family HTH domain